MRSPIVWAVTEAFFFIRSGCIVQSEDSKCQNSVCKYLLSTNSGARHGSGSCRYSNSQNREGVYARGDYILHFSGAEIGG